MRPLLFLLVVGPGLPGCSTASNAASSAATGDAGASALAAALRDTALATRVYRPAEVRRPVVTPPGTATPRFGATPGTATLRFVVDTAGRAELATVEVVPGSAAALVKPLQRALPTQRFLPAIGPAGTPVRQLAEWSVTVSEQPWGYAAALRLSTDPPPPRP